MAHPEGDESSSRNTLHTRAPMSEDGLPHQGYTRPCCVPIYTEYRQQTRRRIRIADQIDNNKPLVEDGYEEYSLTIFPAN
jgi:hypothetical protein